MRTVIIIPTYNEKENIATLVPLIFAVVPDVHVVVADDNSPDGTGSAVLELTARYRNLSLLSRAEKDGFGKAYLNAFNKVLEAPDVGKVVMMDADLSHHPKYLPEMLKQSETYDAVVGSRYTAGGGTSGWELWRRTVSFCGNFYCRTVTRLPLHDCTAGFLAIKAPLLRRIDFSKMDTAGYAFLMELKHALFKAGASFYEVPIIFANRTEGVSKMSADIFKEGIIAPWKMRFKK